MPCTIGVLYGFFSLTRGLFFANLLAVDLVVTTFPPTAIEPFCIPSSCPPSNPPGIIKGFRVIEKPSHVTSGCHYIGINLHLTMIHSSIPFAENPDPMEF